MSSSGGPGSGGVGSPADVVARAGALRAVGQLDAAERVLGQALAAAPEDGTLLTEWAGLQQARGDLAGAEATARAAVQTSPEQLGPYIRLTNVLIAQGRNADAREVTTALIGMAPDVAAVWAHHALASLEDRARHTPPSVRTAYDRALELEPETPEWWAIAALCEQVYGNVTLARTLVTEGLRTAPQHRRLLALRAEYAPVAEQPELLVDLLATDPGDVESRELLDAAVSWQRRLAATAALLPAAVALVALTGSPLATTVSAVLAAVVALLAHRRSADRRRRLPSGYRVPGSRSGPVVARFAGFGAWVAAAVGTGTAWWSSVPALAVFGAAVVLGAVSIGATLLDDDRVLAAARARTGRVPWGTAWRFGGRRQETALWTGLALGVAGVAAAATGLGSTLPAGAVPLVAWPVALVTTGSVVEALRAGRHAPQRYLRTVGVRYRLLAICACTIGLIALGAAGLASPGARTAPEGGPDPDRPVPTFSVPSYPAPSTRPSVPVPLPTFDLPTIPPIDIPTAPAGG